MKPDLPRPFDDTAVLAQVQRVLEIESKAVAGLVPRLDQSTVRAVELLYYCQGRVIVTGMGKMGAIARKAAATLCSTGTPAVYLHPAEAQHGDLGIVSEQDVLIALSNSGETVELISLLPFMHRWAVPVIAVTGNPNSTLGQCSAVVIDIATDCEADPISIAPTSSTTAALAITDALAVALMHVRGFTPEQFAIFHPGGHLGRKMLLSVGGLMHTGKRLPTVSESTPLREAIVTISEKALGAAFIVAANGKLTGIITDGDLRRIFQREPNPLEQPAGDLMTRNPTFTTPDALAAEALRLMEDRAITVLPVVDAQSVPVGALHLHDLVQAGLA